MAGGDEMGGGREGESEGGRKVGKGGRDGGREEETLIE